MGHTFGSDSRQQNAKFSFGIGRETVKKVFIDEIKSKGDNLKPGPGRYKANQDFNANSRSHVMGARLKITENALDRSKKLPGPGSYENTVSAVTGQKSSIVVNEPKFSFGLAKDRFEVPTRKQQSPSPGLYDPDRTKQ